MGVKKTNKRKNKKKKIGSLILLLFLTIIMLATSTYAWFTANRTVKISNIDVNVAASSGLQISTDAKNWKTIISNDDITNGYTVVSPTNSSVNTTDTNMLPSTLVPVSTVGSLTSGKLNMFKGTVNADGTTGDLKLTANATAAEAKGTTGDFVAFDIFLKLDEAKKVYLEVGSGVTGKESSDVTKGLQYAARYAFVTEGNAASTSTQYALVNLLGTPSVKIVEPNFDGHTAYGVTQANAYYTKYSNYNGITASENNTAVSYDGVKSAIATGIELAKTNASDNSSYFQTVTPITRSSAFSKGTSTDGNYELFSLSAGVTKIRVYFWIEGQDVDCENNASGSNLIFKLSFTLNDGVTA